FRMQRRSRGDGRPSIFEVMAGCLAFNRGSHVPCSLDLRWVAAFRCAVMPNANDTIFALSSGRLPAAIAVVRISGPRAGVALESVIGRIPSPRRGVLARVRDPVTEESIDDALALWFPGPNSETGEDV